MKKIGIIILLICSITLLVGCDKKEKTKEKKNENAVNTLAEVSSRKELEDMVGFKIPTIEGKEIINYIAIGESNKKEQARLYYQDGSEFNIKKGTIKKQEEISGIHGAEKKDTIKIEKINITIYEYEETIFGVWKDNEYAYAYLMQNTDKETLTENLEKLIKE